MKKYSLALVILCLILAAAICLPATASAEAGEMPVVDNGLPVVYLNIDEKQGTIEDMHNSGDHSVYCYGTVSIVVPEGFRYSDFPDAACESVSDLEMSIRGRGNSTWHDNKKPYKIKLDKKADLFGLGKNKHWVLVANAYDDSLLKDRITAWLGDEMGFGFTPRGVPVDVVMTGQNFGTKYLGSYYLSENVRVDDNRLEIAELQESDTDPGVITGGYLIQNSAQVRRGSPDIFYTSRGANWATHTPSFDTEDEATLGSAPDEGEETFFGSELGDGYKNNAQQQYIQNYIQHFEDVLFEDGTAYRDLMDVENAAKYWLINEISRNSDGYATGSTYLYKDRDPENGVSKLFWGPLWDFDYAWNHSSYTQGFEFGHLWNKPMFCDRGEGGFVQELHKQWPVMRAGLLRLIADGGVIDQYYLETRASAEADRELHHPGSEFDYRAEVEKLKSWIRDRIAWVDEHFDELDTMVSKVEFVVDGEVWRTDFLTASEQVYGDEKHPELDGRTFRGWLDENGSVVDSPITITTDRVFTAQYVPDDELTHGEDIAWVKDNDVIRFNRFFTVPYQIQYEVIPADAEDQEIIWMSSNEQYATVYNDGRIVYNGPGEVTVTAKLHCGATRTFTLTVLEDDPPAAQAIAPVEPVIEMTEGGVSPCYIKTEPSPAQLSGVTYESDDPSVVTVDELGALTAVAPGETKVHIRARGVDASGEDVELETEVTVIVKVPAEIVYTVVTGLEPNWKQGSADDVPIIVKRSEADETCFSHFTGVEIDGTLLEKDTDYTAEAGSTVVTIKAAALEKLAPGEHAVKVLFDDGSAEATLKILEADADGAAPDSGKDSGKSSTTPGKSSTTPGKSSKSSGKAKTGDERSAIWFALMGVGFGGFVYACKNVRKEQ